MSVVDVRCVWIADLATPYLESALPDDEHTTYELHLVFCTACAAFLADMRTLTSKLRQLPSDQVDAGERTRILAESRTS